MPVFDPAEMHPRDAYYLMTSLVVPRPIAWVGSRSADGIHNLAPHSYFNAISSAPMILHVTSSGEKDTLRNVRATGELTISVVDWSNLEPMNTTAADAPPGVDEFELAGIEKAMARTIDVPYVASAPAAFECTLRTIVSMGTGHMMFADVRRVHVAERIWADGRVDIAAMAPVGRLSGSQYTPAETITKLPRPTYADLIDGPPSDA